MEKITSIPDSLGVGRAEETRRQINNERHECTQEARKTDRSRQRYYQANFPNSIFAKGFAK
jgi:transcriptional regulator of met regulon